MMQQINKLPWVILIALCATLGLAPFNPPHLVEKLIMLGNGELSKPIDIFDLLLHAAPWILLILKAVAAVTTKGDETSPES